MSSHRKVVLATLALGLALAIPAPLAFAQGFDPQFEQTGALDAPPTDEAADEIAVFTPPPPQGRGLWRPWGDPEAERQPAPRRDPDFFWGGRYN